MIRSLDILLSFLGLIILSPVLLIIYFVGYFDTGSPIFRQKRVGKNKVSFSLLKFRTMHLNTQSVATHLAQKSSITKLGSYLRKTKLDEIPQLWNVLIGDMSIVGPRPNLPDQEDLINERTVRNVYTVKPGITGLAQILEIDMSTPKLLAEKDAEMIAKFNVVNYFKYIILTISGKGQGDRLK